MALASTGCDARRHDLATDSMARHRSQRPSYVLASDEPHIRAFNATVGEGSRDALDLTLLPDPWVGRLQAPVVLLNLNPGHSPGDAAAHQLPEVRRAIVANQVVCLEFHAYHSGTYKPCRSHSRHSGLSSASCGRQSTGVPPWS
jgi:hypothetical protein